MQRPTFSRLFCIIGASLSVTWLAASCGGEDRHFVSTDDGGLDAAIDAAGRGDATPGDADVGLGIDGVNTIDVTNESGLDVPGERTADQSIDMRTGTDGSFDGQPLDRAADMSADVAGERADDVALDVLVDGAADSSFDATVDLSQDGPVDVLGEGGFVDGPVADVSDAELDRPCNPVLITDCRSGEYCEAPSCAVNGVCRPRPSSGGPQFTPVCGCDGVTYWNKEHANWLGRSTGVAGRCTGVGVKPCDVNDGTGCGAGEYCYRRWGRFGMCYGGSSGLSWSQCYSRPATVTCPTAPDGDGAQLCPSDCGGAPTCCTNECVLARDGAGQAAEGCGA